MCVLKQNVTTFYYFYLYYNPIAPPSLASSSPGISFFRAFFFTGASSSKSESDDESELFSLDDLKSVMRRDTSALEEMTSAKLKKQMREQGCKFPVFKLATNLTLERMQCLMVVAGATAASCSLLSKMNTPLTKDLTIRCRKKHVGSKSI